MKQGEVVQLEIPGAPEYVAVARQAVEGVARRMDFETSQIDDLKIAVGEACTNAVKYGCPDGDSQTVEIRCTVMSDGLMVEIRNAHTACEFPCVPCEPDLDREGGLGLYLIKHLVDEMDMCWNSQTAVVKLLKRLAK